MLNFLEQLRHLFSQDPFFWGCALGGTVLFAIQFLLSLIDTDFDEGDHGDQDFQWFSKQAITGFVMMLGWAGLTCKREFALSGLLSGTIAAGVGLCAFFVTGLIFRLAKKLTSPGTVFKIEDALGKEAMVYHRIPQKGTGKVSVILQDHTHELDATSGIEEDIASFTQVQIITIEDDKTVRVVPIKQANR